MPLRSKITTDEDEIRRWAEQHRAWPGAAGTGQPPESPSRLRIGFDDSPDDVREINWDDFFNELRAEGLALELEIGPGRFWRIVPMRDAQRAKTPLERKPSTASGRRSRRIAQRSMSGAQELSIKKRASDEKKKTVRRSSGTQRRREMRKSA
jgi:hypothetical protein